METATHPEPTVGVEYVDAPAVYEKSRGPLRLIATHNPFLLLSGVCMLVGCFLINAAAHADPDRVDTVVYLLAAFNLYEILVIGLGLYLVRRGDAGGVRDAAVLLVLEALLLSDFTFLYAEVFTKSLGIGAVVAGVGLALAMVKVAVIAVVLRLRLRLGAGTWAVLAVTLAALFAMPGVFRELYRQEALSDGVMYAGWWLAGILLACEPGRAAPSSSSSSSSTPPDALSNLRETLRWVLPALPWFSVVAHLLAAHWVYQVDVLPHDVAPLMLGAAVVLLRSRQSDAKAGVKIGGIHLRAEVAAVVLCVVAVCLSGLAADGLIWPTPMPGHTADWIAASPLRLALLGTMAVMAVSLWRGLGGAGEVALMIASASIGLLGPTWASIAVRIERVWRLGWDGIRDLLPSTTMEWGITVVIAAFVLLAVGGWWSVRRARGTDEHR